MANTQTGGRTSNSPIRREIREHEKRAEDFGRETLQYLREYARENPESAALWCFGIGFILGWKLKIW
jgi:hypothetical protein